MTELYQAPLRKLVIFLIVPEPAMNFELVGAVFPLSFVPRPKELPTVHNSTPGVIASGDRRSAASMLSWNAVPCVTCTLRFMFQCVDCVPLPVWEHLLGDVTFEEALFFFARGTFCMW